MVYTGITKNAQFTVFLVPNTAQDYVRPVQTSSLATATIKISKDAGNFVAVTNSATVDERGMIRLVLTADEMNADRIAIHAWDINSGSAFNAWTEIFTGTSTAPSATAIALAVFLKLFPFLR